MFIGAAYRTHRDVILSAVIHMAYLVMAILHLLLMTTEMQALGILQQKLLLSMLIK